GRFEKKLWWLLILVVLFAFVSTGANVVLPGVSWAEMPTVNALVRVDNGSATAVVKGGQYALAKGDQIYVSEGDTVQVSNRSLARVVYRGGASSVLCGGTDVSMGHLGSSHGRPIESAADVALLRGQMLMDTRSPSPAYTELAATITTSTLRVDNSGEA